MRYFVEQKYFDGGRTTARTLLESEVIGVSGMEGHASASVDQPYFKECNGYDLYVDVFTDYEEAELFRTGTATA